MVSVWDLVPVPKGVLNIPKLYQVRQTPFVIIIFTVFVVFVVFVSWSCQ